MNLPEQLRTHAEPPPEGLAEPRRRLQPDAAGDVLERQALRQQRARRVEPQVLDEMRRRLAGRLGELAVEAALAVAGVARQRRHVELAVEMVLHPVDQRGER